MNRQSRSMVSVVGLLLAIGHGSIVPAQPLATITNDVTGKFAVYHPIMVEITPDARPFEIAPDLGNVSNLDQFDFSDAQKATLRENGFVAVHSEAFEMYDVYMGNRQEAVPSFVTVDSLLHVFHEQFDWILKTLEEERFFDDIKLMTTGLLGRSLADCSAAIDPVAAQAALRNAAYFGVAMRLLDPESSTTLPAEAAALVEAELALIDAHAGPGASPILVGIHDYSQFIVRGHYEESELLGRYFRAMMWYGSMRLALESKAPYDPLSDHEVRRIALQTRLATRLIRASESAGRPADGLWEGIYRATVFIVGETDDPDVDAIDPIAREVYGENYPLLSADALAEAPKLDGFIAKMRDLPRPKIQSDTARSFRIMGQRFIPDSWITEMTSRPAAGARLPYGLDVMAVLGSARAEQILEDLYHDPPPHLEDLRTTFSTYTDATWASNVYWNWLYCLMPLLDAKGAGYPPFMQTTAWQDKELATALGSWTELRHDTILYSKQSTGITSITYYPVDQGYVEPNPEAFARLAALCRYEIDGLEELGLLSEAFVEYELDSLMELLLALKTIAEKELTQTPITYDEYELIKLVGDRLAELTPAEESPFSDDDMALIADVHTAGAHCLEEAVGRPLLLYVIVDLAGELRVTRGAAYSYHEFTWPAADRLTDSRWRAMLSEGNAPGMPAWINSYFDAETDPASAPRHELDGEMWGLAGMDVELTPAAVRAGSILHCRIKRHSAGLSNPSRVTLTRSDSTTATLEMATDPSAPQELIAAIETEGLPDGTCTVEAEMQRPPGMQIKYRTFAKVTADNSVRPECWLLYR